MDSHGTIHAGGGQTAAGQAHKKETADTSPTAVQSGLSRPESESVQFGECPFCDGYLVQHEHVNEETGEVTDRAFRRPCRRTRCPVCGAINEPYKSSYGQHVADLVDRLGAHWTEVKFLSVTLLKEWADRASVDGWEDSYKVFTGDGGPWTKALRRLRSRDPNLVFAGTISARPSDGRAHLHLVLVTRATVEQVKEAVLRFPLDASVKRKSPGDSTEQFAANCAEYAFENHANAPSARFTASQGHGAGYHSDRAKELRREAVEDRQGAREGVEQTNDDDTGNRSPDRGKKGTGFSPNEGETTGETSKRGPPVVLDGEHNEGERGRNNAVRRVFTRRVGTAVHVNGLGRADLLKVAEQGGEIVCTVAPEIADEAITVRWTEIYTRTEGTSTGERKDSDGSDSTPTTPNRSMNDQAKTATSAPGPLERLRRELERADENKVVSRFTHEKPDGTREITEKLVSGETRTRTVEP